MYVVNFSQRFDTQLRKIQASHARTNELKQAITWILNKTPRIIALDLGEDCFVWVTAQLSSMEIPKVKIAYTVNDEARTVTLVSIEISVDASLN